MKEMRLDAKRKRTEAIRVQQVIAEESNDVYKEV
jgi:hypothetical protein